MDCLLLNDDNVIGGGEGAGFIMGIEWNGLTQFEDMQK
jgi:hypothetical protein